ncbi:MAG: hypothetical protein M1835_007283, partial [Candelina submexicana]
MPSTAINKRRPLQKKSLSNGTGSAAGKIRNESEGVTEEMIQIIKDLGKRGLDQSHTKVAHGSEVLDMRPSNGVKEVVEISSDDDDDDDDDDDEEEEAAGKEDDDE